MRKIDIIKRLLRIIIAAAILFSLTSCEDEIAGEDTEYFAELDGRNVIYKDGMYTFENGLLSFLSFETCETLPVCYKPNCAHDTESCPAYMPEVSTVFAYGDRLYTFEAKYKWDKKNNTATVNTILCRSELSGASRRKFLTLEGCRVNYGAYVKDGNAYFTASELEFDGTGSSTGYTKEYLCRCDLSSREIEKLAEISEGYNALLRISGIYDGNLVLEYREGAESADSEAESGYCFYDTESGNTEAVDGKVIRAQKDRLIVKRDGALYIYSADSDEPYPITDVRYVEPEWGGYAICDGKLILSADGIALELESGREYKTPVCTLIARCGEGFAVRLPGGKGYKFIPDQEFYS